MLFNSVYNQHVCDNDWAFNTQETSILDLFLKLYLNHSLHKCRNVPYKHTEVGPRGVYNVEIRVLEIKIVKSMYFIISKVSL